MQPIAAGLQRTVWLRQGHRRHTATHDQKNDLLLAAVVVLCSASLLEIAPPAAGFGPEYTSDAQMKLPENYRQWVYLTTGFDMSYNPVQQMDHHMFDNVFVNPESYAAFLQTGTWPDKTMLVLEVRRREGRGSINQKRQLSGHDVMGRRRT